MLIIVTSCVLSPVFVDLTTWPTIVSCPPFEDDSWLSDEESFGFDTDGTSGLDGSTSVFTFFTITSLVNSTSLPRASTTL